MFKGSNLWQFREGPCFWLGGRRSKVQIKADWLVVLGWPQRDVRRIGSEGILLAHLGSTHGISGHQGLPVFTHHQNLPTHVLHGERATVPWNLRR